MARFESEGTWFSKEARAERADAGLRQAIADYIKRVARAGCAPERLRPWDGELIGIVYKTGEVVAIDPGGRVRSVYCEYAPDLPVGAINIVVQRGTRRGR